MPQSTIEEKYRWLKPILAQELSIKHLAQVCPFSERAIKYWLASYREHGLVGLENKSTRPKSQPNETTLNLKRRVLELRMSSQLCAQKLSWRLHKEGLSIHPRTIGKILKNEGLVRKYRTRKLKPPIRKHWLPGELVEIDIKYVPQRLSFKRFYQFTAIDCASRWRYLKIYDDMSSLSALSFFKELTEVAPFTIQAIKTDNGSCFTNRYSGYLKSADVFNPRLHPFDLECAKLKIEHYLIDPGKPAQNGHVERSHRTDQEMFYDRVRFYTVLGLKRKIKRWNLEYNNLEHCGLNGLTPNQALREKVQNVRA